MEHPDVRRRTMQAVRSTDTGPELLVRRLVHAMGYRFRLHRKDLPGTPDLVFPRLRTVIFVHGCFWHGHTCARGARIPVNNREYWLRKVARNRLRDRKNRRELRTLGWRSAALWECELRHPARIAAKIRRILATE